MRTYTLTLCYTLFVLDFYIITAQLPPRINIPGALLLPQSKPIRQRVHNDLGPPPRLRRPIPNAAPAPIRPVVEEPEDNPQTNPPQIDNYNNNNNNFDDEVSKLGISALQTAVRQAVTNDDNEPASPSTPILPSKPVQFRPERPVPLLRQDIRDTPPPPPRPLPVQRQEQPRQIQRQDENVRPQIRVSPSRQSPSSPQQFRQVARINPAPAPAPARQSSQFIDLNYERETTRRRKPTVQILRKYRTDNPDGSITWGYENEDGSFKEETLGVDCVTRGKYGYIDPDGVRREYNYETGNKCDQREEQEVEQQQQQNKQPILQSQNRKAQPQFRQLPPSQY